MDTQNYQRAGFTVKNWKETNDRAILVELVPVPIHGSEDAHAHFRCETTDGSLTVIVPADSRIAGELKKNAVFYLDLIPVELASAARTGSST